MQTVGFVRVKDEPGYFEQVKDWETDPSIEMGQLIKWNGPHALVLMVDGTVDMIRYEAVKFIEVPTTAVNPPPSSVIQAHGDVRIEIPPYQALEVEDLPGFIDAEDYGVLDPEENELGRVKCFRFFLVSNAPKVTGVGDNHLTLKGLEQKRQELWAQQGES